ncbi:sigma-54 interaction domain-containing protein [Desulfotomaculum copahuensis]|uniref:sigma-54 interaction domain-containing protein n=1 Tax=Desulfotomaculum copahuensis TaxID=1838280 RepID=UPI000A71E794|nr:sigma 54-interacting transcriptional regulator [Desulfotomaculum copahuensis]
MPDPVRYSADELLQSIFDNGREGILVVDTGGVIRQVAGAVTGALHRTPEQLVGRVLGEVCRRGALQYMNRVLLSGHAEYGKMDTLGGRDVLVDYLPVKRGRKICGALVRMTFLSAGQPALQAEKNVPRSKKCTATLFTVDQIDGSSPQMLDLKETLLKVAPRNSNVLITGESGTGKELFAHALHTASLRRSGPFVKINCAAIPDSLLESEFFGYEEGAFTGGRKGGQVGKLEQAHGGTVFLDEIADLSFALQAKLLRFIQDREIQKLGSREIKVADVRVVAATNVNLEQMVKYKKFREDLYYRLNVVNLTIPPLRERKEDIPALVDRFIRKFNRTFNFNVTGAAPPVLAVFQRYAWPGNVRELENTIERAFNVLEGGVIKLHHLPAHLSSLSGQEHLLSGAAVTDGNPAGPGNQGMTLGEMMEKTEKMVIMQALMQNKGNKARTARALGVSRPGLYKKLVKHHLI